MDSSSMDVVTTGDIEDQQHNQKWFLDHMHMLRPNQEEESNKLGFVILKVPEHKRQPPKAFSPQGWRFGLHNRENLDNNELETSKLATAMQYGLLGEKWTHFCNAIIDDPKAMLACYGLLNGVTNWSNQHIKHVLALDALFLATFIDIEFPDNERRLWTSHMLLSLSERAREKAFNNWIQMDGVGSSLHYVENQIPLVLINKVVDYICNSIDFSTCEGNDPIISNSQYQERSIEYAMKYTSSCFIDTSGKAFKSNNSNTCGEKTHILGATYNAICGCQDLLIEKTWGSTYIHVPSATKMEQSGIKIVGIEGPLSKISYEKKCLFLPKMKIYDRTFSFIRNMAWYEMKNNLNGCVFHDYILFMGHLIQTLEDLDLLIKRSVIDNNCGIKGFEMWIALKEGLTQIPSSSTHHKMKKDIVSRCKLRRYKLWSEFKIMFCSKPWLVLSTIAVILVTVATLVQTYIAIIGSNEMKPKFP